MAYFAKLDENNVVIEIASVNNIEMLTSENVESEVMGLAFLIRWSGGYSNWKQTSYNGKIRKNYAGIGYTYDDVNDVFIAPKPFDNWVLDTATWLWNPPIPMPVDEYFYTWNQETTSWDKGELRPIPEPVVEAPVEAVVEPVVEPAPVTEAVVEPEVAVETPVEAPVNETNPTS